MLFPKSSRSASLTPLAVSLVLAAVRIVVAYGLIYFRPGSFYDGNENRKSEDLRCYRRSVERIHAGEGYYEAAGSELRSRGYPTRSVFNRRLPVLAWLMGHLPSIEVCRVLGVIISLITN